MDFGFADAAVLMLKNKIHRIPIVNDKNQVVGRWQQLYILCVPWNQIFW
jgi:signal-transduction protein with cAMP-binding, CBS, and nucleotidyltransferase domain